MSQPTDPDEISAEDSEPGQQWDPLKIMRERAATTRDERDRSIAELRERLSDEEILAKFGINLDELGE